MARLEDGRVALTVNIRYPAGDPTVTDPTILRPEMLTPGLERAAREQGMTLSLLRFGAPSLFFPREHPVVQTLNQVYHDAVRDWGQPFILNGGCYAHALPNALGFGPGPLWNKPLRGPAAGTRRRARPRRVSEPGRAGGAGEGAGLRADTAGRSAAAGSAGGQGGEQMKPQNSYAWIKGVNYRIRPDEAVTLRELGYAQAAGHQQRARLAEL